MASAVQLDNSMADRDAVDEQSPTIQRHPSVISTVHTASQRFPPGSRLVTLAECPCLHSISHVLLLSPLWLTRRHRVSGAPHHRTCRICHLSSLHSTCLHCSHTSDICRSLGVCLSWSCRAGDRRAINSRTFLPFPKKLLYCQDVFFLQWSFG